MRVRAPRQALDVVSRHRPERRSAAQFEGPKQVSERFDRYSKRYGENVGVDMSCVAAGLTIPPSILSPADEMIE